MEEYQNLSNEELLSIYSMLLQHLSELEDENKKLEGEEK